MSKHMGPTRFTRTCTSTALKRMGGDVTMVKGADSKAVAAGAAAEEGSMGDVIFKAAGVEAAGDTITRGITSQEISRGTIIKEIIKKINNSKVTSMTTVITTVQTGGTGQGRPRDKEIRISEIRTALQGVIRTQRGIISNRTQLGLAHRDISGLVGAIT